MEIRLDKSGVSLPDHYCEDYIRGKLLAGKDIHISNHIGWNCARVLVLRIPVEKRPKITWIAYGNEIHMDDDMRSFDAEPIENQYDMNFLLELL